MEGIKTIIQNIYEMQEHAIITPGNLLNNAKLDNYFYVNYSKKDDNKFMVEMECVCDDEIIRKFYYEFDNNDKLMKVKAIPGTLLEIDTLFDREIELNILLNKYKEVSEEMISKKVG